MLTVGVSPWFSHLLPLQPLRSVATWNLLLFTNGRVPADDAALRNADVFTEPMVSESLKSAIPLVVVVAPRPVPLGSSPMLTGVPSTTLLLYRSRASTLTPTDAGGDAVVKAQGALVVD